MKIFKTTIWFILVCVPLLGFAQIRQAKFFHTYTNLSIGKIISDQLCNKFCDTTEPLLQAIDLKSTYWVYYEIDNERMEHLIIDAPMFYYNIHTYFFSDNMEFIDSLYVGYQMNIKNKKYHTSSNAISIPLKPRVKCYISFQTYLPMGIILPIKNHTDFTNEKMQEYNYNGVINGIFFIAILYSIFFGILLRRKIYLFYMGYVISFWVFMQSINEVLPVYFSWLNLPFTMGYYIIPHYLLSIFLILYSNELLQLKIKLNPLYKFNMAVTSLLIILIFCYLLFDFSWRNSEINILAVVPSYLSAIILLYRKNTVAWFIFIGISLMYIAFACLKLNMASYIPLFFTFSFYGMLEIIIFGISITYWLKLLYAKSEKAMKLALQSAEALNISVEKQNLILENKVAVKTQELLIANQQLEKYIQKVELQNVDLVKDNNSLKVEVVDQILARSEDKIMNYNEFIISYPDDQSCYNRLEYIKWHKGYICPKCANTKYLESRMPNRNPRRRCTLCGYIETTTSNTLFHNVKFSIQKAFYITYIICTEKNRTLEQLSIEIELRTATIHAFSKKIKEAMKATKSQKKYKDGWSHIIFNNSK